MVRHGETVANKGKILQGSRYDSPLTDRGKTQAKVVGKFLKNLRGVTYMYLSDMGRVVGTAQEVFKSFTPKAFKFDKRLRERDFGKWEGELFEKVKHTQGYIEYKGNNYRGNEHGGETMGQLKGRLKGFWGMALEGYSNRTNLVIISHQVSNMVSSAILTNREIEHGIKPANNEIIKVDMGSKDMSTIWLDA